MIAPLVSITFLGAAASLAVSPDFLTVSSSALLGRKKRSPLIIDPSLIDQITPKLMQKVQEVQV